MLEQEEDFYGYSNDRIARCFCRKCKHIWNEFVTISDLGTTLRLTCPKCGGRHNLMSQTTCTNTVLECQCMKCRHRRELPIFMEKYRNKLICSQCGSKNIFSCSNTKNSAARSYYNEDYEQQIYNEDRAIDYMMMRTNYDYDE